MIKTSVNSKEKSGEREPLAIVGIGCRFPGGIKDPSSFWDLVVNAKDGIVKVPRDRWDAEWLYDSDLSKPGKMFVQHGGFIDQKVDHFDALFFGISPREAERMDPQQRLLLETAWEALEDAGIPADRLAGSKTGVFVGAFTFDNLVTQMGIASRHLINAQTPTSSTFTMMSNRLSYFFDFRGPSLSVDTACSSSLVAFHQACQSIWQGESDMALSGGANIIFRPETMMSMCKGGFLSPDGRSKSFDSRANGYGRGEGSGIVVIKPLSQAQKDNDRIYSIIRATGCNQDGRTNGITVPNPVSQQALCRSVCENAGIDPGSIEYVEAHGTGTPVGDPIEANALGSVYGSARPDGETVAIGSIKANFGHTEAAAGVAGIIKASLSLHHATIPPLANLEEPNPEIPFDELGLRLPRTAEPMVSHKGSSKVAINSFGYGGTNAHVILEQYEDSSVSNARSNGTANGTTNGVHKASSNGSSNGVHKASSNGSSNGVHKASSNGSSNGVHKASSNGSSNGVYKASSNGSSNGQKNHDHIKNEANNLITSTELLFPVSARSAEGLSAAVRVMIDALPELAKKYTLEEICYNVATRRVHHNHRMMVRCSSIEDLTGKLQSWLKDGVVDEVVTSKMDAGSVEKPVFVFTGMGPQWWGMGRELMKQEPVFREAVEECDKILKKISGWSIIEELAKDEESSIVTETQVAQPANFVVQYGLTKMLEARGITPAAIIGHSVGEVSAACIAGVLSLEDALTVSYHRSRIQKKAAGQGGMLAVGLPEAEVLDLISAHKDGVSIAAVNSPNSVTLAGDLPVLEQLANLLEEREIFNRILTVEVPYHSHYMEPLKPETIECLADLTPSKSETPIYSTVTSELVEDVKYDANYWCDNIREPVRFADTIENIIADGYTMFVEIGPHPVLSTSLRECIIASETTCSTAHTLRRKKPEMATFMSNISLMFCSGLQLNWDMLVQKSNKFVPLPLYSFQRESYWSESDIARFTRFGLEEGGHPLLWRTRSSHSLSWESPLSKGVLPFLPDHMVDGVVVFPGAGYIESVLALHAQMEVTNETVLTDIEFSKALILDDTEEPYIITIYDEESQKFSVQSRPSEHAKTNWTKHATGVVSAIAPNEVELIEIEEVRSRCTEIVDVEEIYDQLENRGLVYGPHFRRMTSLTIGGTESLARIEPHAEPGRNFESFRLHPTLLDGCFQSLISLIGTEHGGNSTFIPVAIDKLVFRKVPQGGFWCIGKLVESTPSSITGHLTLVDDDGEVIAQIRGFRCQSLAGGPRNISTLLGEIAYETQWEMNELESSNKKKSQLLVFADEGEVANNLLDVLADDGIKPILAKRGDEFVEVGENSFFTPMDTEENLREFIEKIGEFEGVVWLRGLNSSVITEVEGLEAVDSFSTLVRTLDAMGRECRIYGVTENASCATDYDDVRGVDQSPLAGLMKVALNEYPDLHITSIDIDGNGESISALAAEVQADADEDHIALRAGQRYVQRITRVPVKDRDQELDEETPVTISATQSVELEQTSVGNIDSLVLRQTERRDPGAGEIEIKMVATSLNFKDIAKVMNIMSDAALEGTFHERGLGLEASGKVIKIGPDVTDFEVGDHVVFSMQGCFRNYATIKSEPHTVLKIPENLDLALASGTPTVFMTSYYALRDVANLQKGEKILIHAGAGGVGLAAIQIAQWIGAEIFATAGKDVKRDYLRSIGVHHVMNSRSLDFAEQIMEITNGTGVDVVLNSLPKEYIHKSLEVLAPFGRFLEIGKKDLVEGTEISLLPFNKVLNFSTIDFDIMAAKRPDIVFRVISQILDHFKTGVLSPIRTKTFKISELHDAFKFMARSQHIGKVIIDWEAEDTFEALPPQEENNVFKNDGCYVVTGGCGGFGLSIAEWMVKERGVKHMVLLGRSGAKTEEAQAIIESMRSVGAHIEIQKVDVTKHDQVKSLFDELSSRDIPLKGVLHAAAVLDDAPIVDLDRGRFENVMRPKIIGARNLDECTQDLELDMFILFSSVASVVGNVRQANYVAANAWFDAFAAHRRARGLAGTSINWGPIADVGMAATSEVLIKTLEASGFHMLTVEDGMRGLEHAMKWKPTQLGLFEIDWSRWAATEPTSGASPRFAGLIATTGDNPEDHPLFKQLMELPDEDRQDVLNYLLIEQIAETLRMPADKLEPSDSINDLGMDSLMAVELQALVRINMGVELSTLEMTKGENIKQMGALIMSKMNLSSNQDEKPEVQNIESNEVDEMSDEEVDKLLETVTE